LETKNQSIAWHEKEAEGYEAKLKENEVIIDEKQLTINMLRADKEEIQTTLAAVRSENDEVKAENDHMLKLLNQLQGEMYHVSPNYT